jgi:ribulose-phosphate 3-epimerase
VHLHRTVQAIKQLGMRPGVAINPHTPVSVLQPILTDLDIVLVMSVNPGFGGQQFIPETIQKVHDLKQLAEERNPNLIIEVDGGVNLGNASLLAYAGASALVAGSFVFNSENPVQTIEDLSLVS